MILELLFNWLSVALGIVAGTFITWLISYYLLKKYAGKFWKAVTENPDIKKVIEDAKSGKMFEAILEKPEVKDLLKAAKEFIDERKKVKE